MEKGRIVDNLNRQMKLLEGDLQRARKENDEMGRQVARLGEGREPSSAGGAGGADDVLLQQLESDNAGLLSNLMDIKMQLAEITEERDQLKLKVKESAARHVELEGNLRTLEGMVAPGRRAKK